MKPKRGFISSSSLELAFLCWAISFCEAKPHHRQDVIFLSIVYLGSPGHPLQAVLLLIQINVIARMRRKGARTLLFKMIKHWGPGADPMKPSSLVNYKPFGAHLVLDVPLGDGHQQDKQLTVGGLDNRTHAAITRISQLVSCSNSNRGGKLSTL